MELFNASDIAETLAYLGIVSGIGRSGEHGRLPFGASNKKILLRQLRKAQESCKTLGLNVAAVNCSDLITLMKFEHSNRQVWQMCHQLLETLRRELKVTTFFRLTSEDLKYLDAVDLFGGTVSSKFPSVLRDAEEAGKCLAFRRSTACVFHLMRVMETSLKALHKTLGTTQAFSPSWESILRPLTKERDKAFPDKIPIWQANDDFLTQAVTYLEGVKRAWRNPTMHVERRYTEEEAEEVFAAVKGFMKHLSSKLDENGSLP